MFCVETRSFLPNQQSDGRDLARQGEPRQMRFHPAGDGSLVEVLERSSGSSRPRGCTLEDIFQIVVMVEVEPADGQDFLGAFELATDETIFSAGVRPQRQSTVSPQLPLGAEAIRRLDQSAQQSGADRANAGICRSNLMAGCFRASANSSRRVPWRNAAKASNCW